MKILGKRIKENLSVKVVLGFVLMTVLFMVGRSVVFVNEIEPRRAEIGRASCRERV